MKKVIILTLIIILTTNTITAFGVVNFHHEISPLTIEAGETKIIKISLQNMVGEENEIVKAEMTDDGGGIAKLQEPNKEYYLPAKTEKEDIIIEITIPKEAITEEKTITIKTKEISEKKGGMTSLKVGYNTKIYIEIKGKNVLKTTEETTEEKPAIYKIMLIILLTLIIILTTLILIKKKRKKRHYTKHKEKHRRHKIKHKKK